MATPRRFTIVNAEQRSPEWFKARLGRLTGSRAADMLATIKSGEAAARRNYRTQLVLERLTGKMADDFVTTAAMQQGTDREPLANAEYQKLTGQELTASGFLVLKGYMAGCSLDGHIGDFEGIVEFKCPLPATHLSYLRWGKLPTQYVPQVTHNMWVSGAEWCDWMSFNPDFPEHLRVKKVRVYRTELDLADYESKVAEFLDEVQAEYEYLMNYDVSEWAA